VIEIGSGDRRAAFEAGLASYGAASPYVPPMWNDFNRILDPARNPLVTAGNGSFEVFTALAGGRPVGRIVAAIHTASNRRHGTSRGQFGFFDCIDDPGVAGALLAAAERWVAAHGAQEIAGNFNLTAMQMVGVVTGGFEAVPYTDMMWNAPHIPAHLARCGYEPVFPMTTFETDLTSLDAAALAGAPAAQAVLQDPAYTWQPITRRNFKRCLEEARLLLNAGFDSNPMFVPVSAAEYQFQAGEMMWIMDTRLSVIVHHQGRPAGVIVCIPDLNPFVKACGGRVTLTTPWHFLNSRLRNDRVVIIYYSVAPELRGRGVAGAMLSRLVTASRAAGYRRLGTTWIADVNVPSLKQMQRLGARALHRLQLFRKPLGGTS
jgi:GNAT superfamily N-acetyltransferase